MLVVFTFFSIASLVYFSAADIVSSNLKPKAGYKRVNKAAGKFDSDIIWHDGF